MIIRSELGVPVILFRENTYLAMIIRAETVVPVILYREKLTLQWLPGLKSESR